MNVLHLARHIFSLRVGSFYTNCCLQAENLKPKSYGTSMELSIFNLFGQPDLISLILPFFQEQQDSQDFMCVLEVEGRGYFLSGILRKVGTATSYSLVYLKKEKFLKNHENGAFVHIFLDDN